MSSREGCWRVCRIFVFEKRTLRFAFPPTFLLSIPRDRCTAARSSSANIWGFFASNGKFCPDCLFLSLLRWRKAIHNLETLYINTPLGPDGVLLSATYSLILSRYFSQNEIHYFFLPHWIAWCSQINNIIFRFALRQTEKVGNTTHITA